jgi:DNA ligase-1
LLVIRPLGELSGIDPKTIAHRMMGWTDGQIAPNAESYRKLIAAQSEFEQDDARTGHPYPFFLAHALQTDPQSLGEIRAWHAEWKYEGIRAQFVQRNRQSYLWSRGGELITDRFPEISSISLPDGTVIDGEILIWKNGGPGSFADLQRRIGRKTLSSRLLDELPAVLLAFDLLEHEGCDIRGAVQLERRARLDEIVRRTGASVLMLSPLIDAPDWLTLEVMRNSARGRGVRV